MVRGHRRDGFRFATLATGMTKIILGPQGSIKASEWSRGGVVDVRKHYRRGFWCCNSTGS